MSEQRRGGERKVRSGAVMGLHTVAKEVGGGARGGEKLVRFHL